MNRQLNKIIEIFKNKGFTTTDNFSGYEGTKSFIYFLCDKGHSCKTKAKYILYDNVGCKTCQYDNRRSILNIDLKETEYKICNSCGEKKNKSSFGKLKINDDGLRNTCKLCRRKNTISECESKKEKRKKSSYKYCKERPFGALLSRCKSNHNKKGMINFDITEEYLNKLYDNQLGKCYWSGIDMCKDSIGLGKLNTVSVDRLDCKLGYVKENIVLCCKFINLGRGNVEQDEFSKFIKNFITYLSK